MNKSFTYYHCLICVLRCSYDFDALCARKRFILRARDHGLFILRAKDHGLLSYAQRIMDLLSYAQRIMDLLSYAQRYFEVTIFLK